MFHRFIPAGAGNTVCPSGSVIVLTVYPRWRGEHLLPVATPARCGGLSPLARGTLLFLTLSRCTARFIPAGAGNTPLKSMIAPFISVYPRWRGEHRHPNGSVGFAVGLSPLARGTPLRQAFQLQRMRFIPAGAGNTLHGRFFCGGGAVYPRWRGEHNSRSKPESCRSGLSPLARGTHLSPCKD